MEPVVTLQQSAIFGHVSTKKLIVTMGITVRRKQGGKEKA